VADTELCTFPLSHSLLGEKWTWVWRGETLSVVAFFFFPPLLVKVCSIDILNVLVSPGYSSEQRLK
jgi:hypothetical protein